MNSEIFNLPGYRYNQRNAWVNGINNKRYYSSLDAEIYFNDILIDEVVELNFTLSQGALPIFGYNSYVYDAIAIGSRLITGTFTINFTEVNSIEKTLNKLKTIPNNSINDIIIKQKLATLEVFKNRTTNRKPRWYKPFQIISFYGGYSDSENAVSLIIDDINITGVSQRCDFQGNPLVETYSFIARDIIDINYETKIKRNQKANIKQEDIKNIDNNFNAYYFEEQKNNKIESKIIVENTNNIESMKCKVVLNFPNRETPLVFNNMIKGNNRFILDVSKELKNDISNYYDYSKIKEFQLDVIAENNNGERISKRINNVKIKNIFSM